MLEQGPGFNGIPTPVPGSSPRSGTGADAEAIAHWDVVPFQTFKSKFNVGVLAYHFNGIERVDFSVDDGPWVSVYEATPNPQTKGSRPEHTAVEEYWVTLDPEKLRKGPLEIRAIAYPAGAGRPAVLQGSSHLSGRSSMILNVDVHNELSHERRYATLNGDDANDCTSVALACRSIYRAIVASGMSSNVDGAEVLLGEGTWIMPELSGVVVNTSRWLTITSIPGSDPNRVIINGIGGAFDGSGLYLKLARFSNLTFTGPINKAANSLEDYMWFDRVTFRNPPSAIPYEGLRTGSNFMPQGYAPVSVYHTDVLFDDMGDGPRGAVLARNVFADHTGGGHASQSETVVNYTTNVIFGSGYNFPGGPGIDYHGDLYQMWGRSQNIILYGIRTTPGAWASTRGIVQGTGETKNIAIVKSDVAPSGWAFSFCGGPGGGIDHFIVQESLFTGASDWCSEGGGPLDPAKLRNILFDRSVFDDGTPNSHPGSSLPLPGVKVLP